MNEHSETQEAETRLTSEASEERKPRKARSTQRRKPPSPTTKTKILPTPRIAFAKQVDILRAHANAADDGQRVTNERVAELVGMAASTVSLANPFFADVGLIQRTDGGYVPSPAVVSFARTYRWDTERASRELAPVLRETWFAKRLLPRLGYAPMSEREALTELDKEAMAGPNYQPQLRMLLDYLEVAGLIVRDGERVEPGEAKPREEPPPPPPKQEPPELESPTGQHPLIQGLLRELPQTGETWTSAKRDQWLELAKLTVQMIYPVEDEAGQTPEPPPRTQQHSEEANPEVSEMPH